MEMDLREYIKVYPNMVEDLICDAAVNELQRVDWQQHRFYDVNNDTEITKSGDKELDISNNDIVLKPYIMNKIWNSYLRYVTDLEFSWFGGWKGFSPLRFNKYEETKMMANHCDHIHSLFEGDHRGIPIMTALGALNDDYEGGNFIMFDNDVINMQKGSIMVFPSNFLYPHRIEPVIKGVRYTYVSWAW